MNNKFLIFVNNDKDADLKINNAITEYLREHGADAVSIDDKYEENGNKIDKSVFDGVDAVIVLGGDGTMLRATALLEGRNIPIMGVNLGTLGFLTEVEQVNVYDALDRLLQGKYEIEKRMMIEGRVSNNTFHALNDIVISRAGFSRIICLNIYVNNQLLDTYEADGIIVSTPTGSTGYNLSAGGPIVSPKSKAIVVTPISPHSLTSKSVVFDSTDNIKIEIVKKRKTQETEAIVSFDGMNNKALSANDEVFAKLSEREVSIIKMYDNNFYSVLREKIGG